MTKRERRSRPGSGHGRKKPTKPVKPSRSTSGGKKGVANNKANNNKKQHDGDERLFSVEKIVDCKLDKNGEPTYKTRWTGYSASEDTWEPYENVVSTGHVDWYERQQRQQTLKETSVGVAVIEYEDGECEMVDLRTEKFRSYRSDDEDEDTTTSSSSDSSEDENNFELVAEGEMIEILWKHANIYFPCKVISWTPLRATRRSTTQNSRSSLWRPPSDEVKVAKNSSTKSKSSQGNKQEALVATTQKRSGTGMAKNRESLRDKNQPLVKVGQQVAAPAKKPTKLEPNATVPRTQRQRGQNQLDAITPNKESKQRLKSTDPVEEAGFVPRKHLKRQGEKGDTVGGANKKSKLEEPQPPRTESAQEKVVRTRILRERNKDRSQTSSSVDTAPSNKSMTTGLGGTIVAAEAGGGVQKKSQQLHDKLRSGGVQNQPVCSVVPALLSETASTSTSIVIDHFRGILLDEDEAQYSPAHDCSSCDNDYDEGSSALYEDEEGELSSTRNEGIPLYDEPEDDFDSSTDSDDDDDDDEEEEDESDFDEERHHSYQHYEEHDGSDDGIDDEGKGYHVAYQAVVEGPKLTFEEQWTLKLKRTQEFFSTSFR